MSVPKHLAFTGVLLLAANLAYALNDREDRAQCNRQDFQHYVPWVSLLNYLNTKSQMEVAGLPGSEEQARFSATQLTDTDLQRLDQLLLNQPELCHLAQRVDFSLMFGLLKNYDALTVAIESGAISTGYIIECLTGNLNSQSFIINLVFHLNQLKVEQLSLEISMNFMVPFRRLLQCSEPFTDETPKRNLVYHTGFNHIVQLINAGEPESRLHPFVRKLCELDTDQRYQYLESYQLSVDLATGYIDELTGSPGTPRLQTDIEHTSYPIDIRFQGQVSANNNQTRPATLPGRVW